MTHGVRANESDSIGNTALHMAVWYERDDVYQEIASWDQAYDGQLQLARNNDGRTPLQLAGLRASSSMVKAIISRQRVLNWSFGPVKSFLYPMSELDVIRRPSREYGLLELLVREGTLRHAKLLRIAPMHELIRDKWFAFARAYFMIWFFLYIAVAAMCTAVQIMTPLDVNDYSGGVGVARSVIEYVITGVVLADVVIFEGPELWVWAFRDLKRHSSGYSHGTFIFTMVGWLFRLLLLVAVVLRATNQEDAPQRAMLALTGVTSWLYVLCFFRGFKGLGTFVILVERMMVDMINWMMVFITLVLAFASAFAILYPDTSAIDADAEYQFANYGTGLYTLVKWTVAEFNWYTFDWAAARSTATAFVLFVAFVLLVTVILFNMLIAMMANMYTDLKSESTELAHLLWASHVVQIQRRLNRLGIVKATQTGAIMAAAGTLPEVRYIPVMSRHLTDYDLSKDLEEAGLSAVTRKQGAHRVLGFPSMYTPNNVSKWQDIMARVNQRRGHSYIANFEELSFHLGIYHAHRDSGLSREAVAHMLVDMVFNDAVGTTEKDKKDVIDTATAIASHLDPDRDDFIPIEGLYTFCRLSRNATLTMRKSPCALIIVDMQQDFITGSMPVKNWHNRSVAERIQALRRTCEWDVVIMTQEWHPADHCSFEKAAGSGDGTEGAGDKGSSRKSNSFRARASSYGESFTVTRRGTLTSSQKKPQDMLIRFTNDVDDMIWPPHCVQGTPGAEFHADVPVDGATIVRKGEDSDVDSYSAFWNNDRTDQTRLLEYLFDAAVETVVVCGIGLDVAVGRTARDAALYGFNVIIAEDASCVFDSRWNGEMETELQNYPLLQRMTTQAAITYVTQNARTPRTKNDVMDIAARVQRVKRAVELMQRNSLYKTNAADTKRHGRSSSHDSEKKHVATGLETASMDTSI